MSVPLFSADHKKVEYLAPYELIHVKNSQPGLMQLCSDFNGVAREWNPKDTTIKDLQSQITDTALLLRASDFVVGRLDQENQDAVVLLNKVHRNINFASTFYALGGYNS